MQPEMKKAWDEATPLNEHKGPAITGAEETEQKFTELAALLPVDYDRQRGAVANELGILKKTLDAETKKRRPAAVDTKGGSRLDIPTPDPWPEPVDGESLAADMAVAFKRYLVLPKGAEDVLALWTLQTHVFQSFYITPRLAITSPEKECGKTTTLEVLSRVTAKPFSASNISAPAFFRTVELEQPTLLIDEADTFLNGKDELRGILNSGHARNGAVIRTVGEDYEPRKFNTWAPVAIAKIGAMPDTLHARSIVIGMRRKLSDEQVAKFRIGRTPDLDTLGRKAARWAEDNIDRLGGDPTIPEELYNRAADNWEPLLTIADAIGGEWPERARQRAVQFSGGGDNDESTRAKLLADIETIFIEQKTDWIASQDICDALAEMEDRPWPEWGKGHRPITPAALSRQLSAFKIKPRQTWKDGSRNARGYHLEDFGDALSRYTPRQSVRPLEAKETGACGEKQSAREAPGLAPGNPSKPALDNDPSSLALRQPPARKWESEV